MDSEDHPIAESAAPHAQLDEFACLRVASVERVGAFLDWGLPKNLLLPFRSQLRPVQAGEEVVVRVFTDPVSGRPVATTKLERFLEAPPENLRQGEEVELLVYEATELGYKAIVDGHFGGLLYRGSETADLEVGATLLGYIERIRSDGKIDLSLSPAGKARADAAKDLLEAALREAGGRLEIGDRSEPEEIRRVLGLSKKAFKRAAGGLYRERRVKITGSAICFTEREHGDD